MKREELEAVINFLKLGDDVPSILVDTAEKNQEGSTPTYYRVKDLRQLSVIANYLIENMCETTGSGTEIVLKRELPEGGYMYRDLIIGGEDHKYLSDEY